MTQTIQQNTGEATQNHPFIEELQWRGLLHDSTPLEELNAHLNEKQRRFYIGFDPSAPSLTIGNLLAVMMVVRGIRAGLSGVVLLGGGTGLIGDPSGKSVERSLLPVEEAQANVERHRKMITTIIERAVSSDKIPQFVDNYEWLGKLTIIEFLRDVGKHFSVSEMMRRDSVARRLNDPNQGLSYTEFAYSLLQSYDFMRLCQDHGVTMQMGASDQWGNIVAGIDYVRRVLREPVHGLTCPLLLRADGTKFGKSESGAIWLSADRTSPYQFYQFLLNLADEEVKNFALKFSLESKEVLDGLFQQMSDAPEKRALQKHIAEEVTTLVHGAEECKKAQAISAALFSGDIRSIDPSVINDFFNEAPSAVLGRSVIDGEGVSIIEFLVQSGLASSKGDAKRKLESNGLSINGEKVSADRKLTISDLLHENLIMAKHGKQWKVVRFE
ncbi:tyrosine--tRNA ligase [Candidatus Obscuribacterales bacterium]|nr:tyrosine--tRNA ligase [Candidatus Obscuribacterales bacterium]